MSCSDILLSFLADVGEDWNDSFIFPTDGASIDVSDYLNKSDYVVDTEIECPSPASSYSAESSSAEDEKDFQDALDVFSDMGSHEDYFPFLNDLGDCTLEPTQSFVAPLSASSLKKRKADVRPSSSKKTKAETDEKVAAVVLLLQKYKVKKEIELAVEKANAARRFRFTNSLGTAESYLQAILGATPATPTDLLKLSSPTASFNCKALSSLHSQVQTKKAQLKLAAWCPVSQSQSVFPENHTGIGQVAAASRAFHAAMSDMISVPLLQKISFSVTIQKEDAIVSKYGEQLSAPFVWKSVGMIAMGYPEELEFNGLIRCTFVKEGVSAASVSFDACKVVRQSQIMFNPKSVSAGLL